MHGLMRTVGFGNIVSKKALEEVLKDVVQTGDVHKINAFSKGGENIVEIKKYYAPKMGLVVHGYYDENNIFVREYYFPFIESSNKPIKADITLNRHIGKTSFAGSCEDLQIGLTTIFYLQNGIDFIKYLIAKGRYYIHAPLLLAGLASSGTILLPVNKTKKQIFIQKMVSQLHRKWINDAKNGDESAIESLTLEDYDLYARAVKQVQKEDLFTVVESTFMPYGVECDHYMIIGEISSVEEFRNSMSDEKIYYMTINCNDIELSIAVNESDLTGQPVVGRRYRGSIWLQGIVDFSNS